MLQNQSPELLMPAGSYEKLEYAYAFGADACYVGVPLFSLRARENEFDLESLEKAVELRKKLNKKIYFTSSQEAAVFTSSTVDIASVLNGFQYDNVVLTAHKKADKEWPEAAALGSVCSSIPGIGDLFAKTLVGAPIDSLS